MVTQMIVRLDPCLKNKVSNLAKKEGKSLSELVRELLEKYAKERDMGPYIDNLWERIGKELYDNKIVQTDIDEVIQKVRSSND